MESDLVGLHFFDKTKKLKVVDSQGTIGERNCPNQFFCQDASYVFLPDEQIIYITGGRDATTRDPTNSARVATMPEFTIQELPNLPEAKINHGSCRFGNILYTFGGKDADIIRTKNNYALTEDAQDWEVIASLNSCEGDTVCCVFKDSIYISASYVLSLEVYDTSANTCTLLKYYRTEWNSGPQLLVYSDQLFMFVDEGVYNVTEESELEEVYSEIEVMSWSGNAPFLIGDIAYLWIGNRELMKFNLSNMSLETIAL